MSTTVAIIGSGFGMYGLLPAFSSVKSCVVVSICGKNSPRMEMYCKKFGIKRYTDWKKMLQEEDIDAVAIAVIPKYQYEIAKYALENNIAVFAEKPMTIDVETSLKLSELAKEKKLPNMLDFIFPEIPEWQEAKKIIQNDSIGKITNIDVKWQFLSYDLKNSIQSWKTDTEKGGGALSFYFSHVFYYLEYFLGKIKNLECNLQKSEKSLNNGETTIDMKLVFDNGCLGNVSLNINDNHQIHSIKFNGTSGKLILENNSDQIVDNFDLNLVTNEKEEKIRPILSYNYEHDDSDDPRVKTIVSLAEKFIFWCTDNVPSRPNFQDGLRVQQLIESARN